MGGGSIVWFRQDLRLADNPALTAAVRHGGPIVPVFILDDSADDDWRSGAASRWWLHESLSALEGRLRARGSRLTLIRGPAYESLLRVIEESGSAAVYWNRRYEPASVARDARIKRCLSAAGIRVDSFNAALLREPWEVKNGSGHPYRVFGAFRRALLARSEPASLLPAPGRLAAPRHWPETLQLHDLDLKPRLPWYRGLASAWAPGEAGARRRLSAFLRRPLHDYSELRERPSENGTSRLSPHLHFGEISPRTVWHATARAAVRQKLTGEPWRNSTFVAELIWREFAHHLLFHFPQTPAAPLDARFASFRWRCDPQHLRAWQRGETGVPMVDAGMRELWATGWMHNRVRMIVASFLVKNLRIHWLEGARWFWDTLVDADLAANTLNWQWVAGCGADAAPYFRVFNPVLQGERFDPAGAYIRRWVPELAALEQRYIHTPWLSPVPPPNYPRPIVDLRISREEALKAYHSMRGDAYPGQAAVP